MERVVVTFDIHDTDNDVNIRMVKLWNSSQHASDFINAYMDQRPEMVWKYLDGEDLQRLSPGAVIEFYGYANKDAKTCDDMITVFHTELDDPEEDPCKRILRGVIEGFEESDEADIPQDEKEHLEYAIDMFREVLEKMDAIEAQNRAKLTVLKGGAGGEQEECPAEAEEGPDQVE